MVLLSAVSAACGPAGGAQSAATVAVQVEPPVQGTLRIPVFLTRFPETADSLVPAPSDIAARFTPDAPGSLSSYYGEMSGGLLRVVGDVLGDWRPTLAPMAAYATSPGFLLKEVVKSVQAADTAFNWGLYDNDGPDDVPNSGDDDGIVDVVVLVHSELGSECGGVDRAAKNGPHTSRQVLTLTDTLLLTHTPSRSTNRPKPVIAINEFIVAAGQGGDDICTRGAPLPIGPVAHELGHILGIPELYDNQDPPGPGIGLWGLMAMGGFQTPSEPVHMTAWPLVQLGWADEVTLESDTVLDIEPIEVSRRVYSIAIAGTSEQLLLSNRQPVDSDTSLVVRSPFGGRLASGLLLWHVDSLVMRSRGFDASSCWKTRAALCGSQDNAIRNTVNVGTHDGLVLEVPDADLVPYAYPFNPFDSTVANPTAALRPGATFTYPGFVTITVLDGAPDVTAGTLRVAVDFLGGTVLGLGDVELPDGEVGQPYAGSVSVKGPGAPRWTVVGGEVPPGLTFSPEGRVTGTPQAAGTFPLVVTATTGAGSLRTHLSITITKGAGP